MASEAGAPAAATADSKADTTLVTIHWLEVSRATRVLWLCEELNIPYQLKTYKRGPDKLAPPELRQIHPLGKSPLISVPRPGSDQPLVLAESGAILEFLTDHWGPSMVPAKWQSGLEGQIGGETESFIRYRHYMHYAEGSLMSHNLVGIIMSALKKAKVPFFLKPVTSAVAGQVTSAFLRPRWEDHFAFLTRELETSPDQGEYLCGKEMTTADIMMEFAVDVGLQLAGTVSEKYPRLRAYVDLLRGREAYKRAVRKVEEIEGVFKTDL